MIVLNSDHSKIDLQNKKPFVISNNRNIDPSEYRSASNIWVNLLDHINKFL